MDIKTSYKVNSVPCRPGNRFKSLGTEPRNGKNIINERKYPTSMKKEISNVCEEKKDSTNRAQ